MTHINAQNFPCEQDLTRPRSSEVQPKINACLLNDTLLWNFAGDFILLGNDRGCVAAQYSLLVLDNYYVKGNHNVIIGTNNIVDGVNNLVIGSANTLVRGGDNSFMFDCIPEQFCRVSGITKFLERYNFEERQEQEHMGVLLDDLNQFRNKVVPSWTNRLRRQRNQPYPEGVARSNVFDFFGTWLQARIEYDFDKPMWILATDLDLQNLETFQNNLNEFNKGLTPQILLEVNPLVKALDAILSPLAIQKLPIPIPNEPPAGRGEPVCVVCADRSVKTVLDPCGHSYMCVSCANDPQLTPNCAICRQEWIKILRTHCQSFEKE